MRRRLLLAAVVLASLAGSAVAGPLSEVKYQLYWTHSGSGPDVRVLSADPLPAGSNVAPDNVWRYDYALLNKSPNALYAAYLFFNSDTVNRAAYVSATAPTNWTVLKQGVVAWKIRYQTTVPGSKIPSGGTLLCSGKFSWIGSTVPGSQNYDAVNDGGSESGQTTEDITVAATSETWGRIKSLYR